MLGARYWELESDGSIIEVTVRCPCGIRYVAGVGEEDFELMEIGEEEVRHGAKEA